MLLSLLIVSLSYAAPADLLWPVNCIPGVDCTKRIGFADPEKKGMTHDCSLPGYKGHEGTDITLQPEDLMDDGVEVYAAAAGRVLWVFDGKYDRCPNPKQPDCADPTKPLAPGMLEGNTVCTPLGKFCREGDGSCFWCFAGGNMLVIKHEGLDGVFATRYDHFRKGSILVKQGDLVKAGQVIGQAGSAGRSTAPHLHFEVWGKTYYDPVDPWPGVCNSRVTKSLWKFPDKPWASLPDRK